MQLTKSDIKNLAGILAGCVIITGLLIAGAMDEQAAIDDQANYCDMVRGGHWPDYKGTFADQCGGERLAYHAGVGAD